MPRYSAEQIYALAISVGFSPDQATTMTAIALAESGGDPTERTVGGEDSRGLWQINVEAHPDLGARYNLYDPKENAMAALIASKGGTDVSAWSTTHHGTAAKYMRFKDQAQAAAAAHGDGPNHGVWTGTAGYGHPMTPGDPRGGRAMAAYTSATSGHSATDGADAVNTGHDPATGLGFGAPRTPSAGGHGHGEDFGVPLQDDPSGSDFGIPLEASDTGGADAVGVLSAGADGGITGAAPTGAHGEHLHTFLHVAQAQKGDEYIFGVMDRLDDPNPQAFDCSMLVQWSAHQAGVDLPRNAWDQYKYLHEHGMIIPVDQAIHTPGALLFSFNTNPDAGSAPGHQHVAISLGDGKTIEALGRQYGVNNFDATTRRFNYAAVVPGISDQVGPVGPSHDLDPAGGIPVGWPYDHTPGTLPAADPHPTGTHPGGPADPGPHITDAAPVPGAGAPPRQPGSGGQQFQDLLAYDPDQLDSGGQPGGGAPPADPHAPPDPHGADPHGAPPPPPPPTHEPLYFTLVDANNDGLDDSLEQAGHLPPGPHPAADDGWHHGHDHGGGHP